MATESEMTCKSICYFGMSVKDEKIIRPVGKKPNSTNKLFVLSVKTTRRDKYKDIVYVEHIVKIQISMMLYMTLLPLWIKLSPLLNILDQIVAILDRVCHVTLSTHQASSPEAIQYNTYAPPSAAHMRGEDHREISYIFWPLCLPWIPRRTIEQRAGSPT